MIIVLINFVCSCSILVNIVHIVNRGVTSIQATAHPPWWVDRDRASGRGHIKNK